MLIDITYFTKGERQLMNATGTPMNANENAVKVFVEGYIASLEERFLKNIVGKEVCDIMSSGSESNVEVTNTIAGKLKESFADYVFFHILRDMNETPTITGVVRLKNANAYVTPRNRQVSVWNSMVDRNREFVEWAASDACPIKIRVSSHMLAYINPMNL